MSKPRKDELLKSPIYRGGEEAMQNFIIENLRYPKEALDSKIEGEVEVAFDVDMNGKVRKVKILKGLGYGCDEEVIRLVSLLKFEKAYNKGRNVTLHKKLKVNFKLPQTLSNRKINYHLVTSKPKSEEKPSPTKIGYTISF